MRRPRYADVASTLALLVALSGTAYAAAALAPNSVGTTHLQNDAVTAPKIKAGAVGTSEVAAESLTLSDIRGANVTGTLSFDLSFQGCDVLTLDVPGAKEGQVAVFSFTKPEVLPEGISSALPVVSEGKVELQFCNSDQANVTVAVEEAPFRVVTFG